MRMRRIRLICLLCVLFFCYCNNHDHKNISIPTLDGNTINSIDSSASKSSAGKLTMHDVSLDTNDELLPCLIYNKYEGRLVYVDVWATACYGCIAEIPYSKSLQQNMAQKNIAFVYLCCNSKPENWQKVIQDHQLGGDHYFLNQKQSSRLFKEYKILKFPTYLIFNQKGQLVSRDGPSPSSGNIVKYLNQAIAF